MMKCAAPFHVFLLRCDQRGAEYDGREKMLSDVEATAKGKKLGVWSKKGGETPAQYKARIKREKAASA